MKYWPFGATRSGLTIPSNYAYTGQEIQTWTTIGAYNSKARFYSTMLGRFVSADSSAADGLNPFAYVKNNPMRYNDPSGHCVGGLLCTPDIALNIQLCGQGPSSCAAVFYAKGLPSDLALIESAYRFARAARLTDEFRINYWREDIHPFSPDNLGRLEAGYRDPTFGEVPLEAYGDSISRNWHEIVGDYVSLRGQARSWPNRVGDRCGQSPAACHELGLDVATASGALAATFYTGDPGLLINALTPALYVDEVQLAWMEYQKGNATRERVLGDCGRGI